MDNKLEDVPNATATSLFESRWSSHALVVATSLVLIWSLAIRVFDLTAISRMVGNVVMYVTMAFMVIGPLVARQPRSSRLGLPTSRQFIVNVLLAVPVTVLVMFVTGLYLTAAEALLRNPSTGAERLEGMSRAPLDSMMYFYVICMVIVGPICEEVFYRGFIYNEVRKRLSIGTAILFQAGLFGISHAYPIVGVGSVVIIGILLAGFYQWRKSILAPIFVHMLINGIIATRLLLMAAVYWDSAIIGITPDPDNDRCVIGTVAEYSPAFESGLVKGDVIVGMGEYTIVTSEHLFAAMADFKPGESIVVTYERDGQLWEIDVDLISRNEFKIRNENRN